MRTSVPYAWPVQAQTQPPQVIRVGVATCGVGKPARTGGSTVGLVDAQGLLEKESEKDGIKINWVFFKDAGPAVNEALVNRQWTWSGKATCCRSFIAPTA